MARVAAPEVVQTFFGPGLVDVSKFGFKPIGRVDHCQRAWWSAAPVAVCRERGVDFSSLQKAEIQLYMDAGPVRGEAARLVRAQVFERRGGVLPRNWELLDHYKENLDMIERMRVRRGA